MAKVRVIISQLSEFNIIYLKDDYPPLIKPNEVFDAVDRYGVRWIIPWHQIQYIRITEEWDEIKKEDAKQ